MRDESRVVSFEVVGDGVGEGAGERCLWPTRERAEEAAADLARTHDCDVSEFRIVQRDEAPNAE